MDRQQPSPARRGRPKDPAKREALLAAARKLFLADGPDATPMEAFAVAAGVSKATLYAYFSNREALLEAVIRRESERIVSEDYPGVESLSDLESTLIRFGERLLTFMADPQRVGFERLIASAAEQHPELARRFFDAGPGRGRAMLAKLVEAGVAQGALAAPDTAEAVSDLVGLWQGFMRIETALGYRKPPKRAEIRAQAAHGVRQFLRLYGAARGRA